VEPFLGGEEARLEFARKLNIPVEPGIDEALITREELSGFLPSYWKRFIMGSGERPRIVDPKTGGIVPTADPAIGQKSLNGLLRYTRPKQDGTNTLDP
jgi:hypothetical protein